jgi:hypothetical protein
VSVVVWVSAWKAIAGGAAVAATVTPLNAYESSSGPGLGAAVGAVVGAAVAGVEVVPPPPHAATKRSNPTANPGHSLEIRMRPPGEMQASNSLGTDFDDTPLLVISKGLLNLGCYLRVRELASRKRPPGWTLLVAEERELNFLCLSLGGTPSKRGRFLEIGLAAERVGDLLSPLDDARRETGHTSNLDPE